MSGQCPIGMSLKTIPFDWDAVTAEHYRYCQTGNHPLLPKMKEGKCFAGTGGGRKTLRANNTAVKAYKRRQRACKVKSHSLKTMWNKK